MRSGNTACNAPPTSHRWLTPLLADLAAQKAARFVELIHRLGLSATGLTRTLEAALSQGLTALGKHGLVTRDVVDMRPPASRYGLTKNGALLAAACA